MSKIQLPNLESLEESPNTNDLFLIRRSGSNSDSKIRYSKLVKNILPQLTYDYNPINATDAFIMRRINSSDVYSPEEVKVQFKNLYSSVNNTIKTSNVFDIVSFTDSSVSILIALKTSYGLPLTELKKNMEICFISDQDRLTDKKFKIRIDNISIDSGILLYNDSSVAKELKKGLEVRTIYNGTDFIISSISDIFTGLNFFDDSTIVDAGDLLIIRKKDESNNKKIKYYQLASNIIPQLEVYYDTITSSDLLPIRRIGPQGGYLESNDRKVTFSNLCNHVNNTIKTSNFFDVDKVEESSISKVIYLKTSYGLPVTELKKNMEVCFTPDEDRLTGKKFKIRIDNISIDSGILLYNDSSFAKELKKGLEVRTIYNGTDFIISSDSFTGLNFFDDSTTVDAGDLLIIRKKDESNNKKIKYYQLASNIIPQLEVYYDTITSNDLLPIRRIDQQGDYLESNDRKVTFSNLCNHVNNTIKTSNFFDVDKVEESSISTVIYLKTSYGLPVTELKKNMEVCFIPNTDYNLLGSTTGYKIRVDDASISQGVLLYYPYDSINNRYKQILPKNIEVRAVYNGENFLLSYFYTKS